MRVTLVFINICFFFRQIITAVYQGVSPVMGTLRQRLPLKNWAIAEATGFLPPPVLKQVIDDCRHSICPVIEQTQHTASSSSSYVSRKIVPSAIDPTCVADGPFRLWVLYIAHTLLGVKKSCWDQERAHFAFEDQSERTFHR